MAYVGNFKKYFSTISAFCINLARNKFRLLFLIPKNYAKSN